MANEKGRLSDHLYIAPETDEASAGAGEAENVVPEAVEQFEAGVDVAPMEMEPAAELIEEEEISDEEYERQSREKRSTIIRTVCGVYLLYITYELIRDTTKAYQTEGWKNTYIISIVAGVVFGVISIALLFSLAKKFFGDKNK